VDQGPAAVVPALRLQAHLPGPGVGAGLRDPARPHLTPPVRQGLPPGGHQRGGEGAQATGRSLGLPAGETAAWGEERLA
jgi:hypothetical protein